jgi:hypothetical protein
MIETFCTFFSPSANLDYIRTRWPLVLFAAAFVIGTRLQP